MMERKLTPQQLHTTAREAQTALARIRRCQEVEYFYFEEMELLDAFIELEVREQEAKEESNV